MNKQEIIEWAQCYTVGHAKELLEIVQNRIIELYGNPSDHIMRVTVDMYRRVARDYLFEQIFVRCPRYLRCMQDMEVRKCLEQIDFPTLLCLEQIDFPALLEEGGECDERGND